MKVSFTHLGLLAVYGQVGLAQGLLDPITGPLAETIKAVLSGEGLIQGALGAIEGALGQEATYDYVVVGGGTAGNAIGYRLAEAGHSVAIVEAGLYYEIQKPVFGTTPLGDIFGVGSSPLDTNVLIDWGFETEPMAGANNRKIHYARGKTLGGSSALNFMAYQRGSTGSYDKWAEAVGDDSYRLENWMPYFQKSVNFTPPENEFRPANVTTKYNPEAFTTPGGPVQVGYPRSVLNWGPWLKKALESLGLKETTGFCTGQLLGTHYASSTIRASDQTRSTSTEYIYKAVDDGLDNLKVYTQTLARKVIFDSDKKATGVEVTSLGAVDYTIHASHEVILSAGAFQSPQLLMVSGVGPSQTLSDLSIPIVHPLEGVGQNLWDHMMFGPAHEVNFHTLNHLLTHPATALAPALVEYATNATGPFTNTNLDMIGWEGIPESYLSNLSSTTLSSLSSAGFTPDWPHFEYLPENGFTGNFSFPILDQPTKSGADFNKNFVSILGAMVAPLSRGNVTISSDSTKDAPIINPNFLSHPADQEVAVLFYRRMREVFRTDVLREILVDPEMEDYPGYEYESDEEILNVIRNAVMTVWHASCTCKMGKAGEADAVVDNEARVFGVQGLRVVDASSFALLPPGHPMSTIYALAEKIADGMVKGREGN